MSTKSAHKSHARRAEKSNVSAKPLNLFQQPYWDLFSEAKQLLGGDELVSDAEVAAMVKATRPWACASTLPPFDLHVSLRKL